MTSETQGHAVLDHPLDGIARIRMSRPDTHNALTFEMLAELAHLLDGLRRSPPRALIVTGTDRSFCAGAYVRYFTDASSPMRHRATAVRDYVGEILQVFGRLRDAPYPTIAAINGHALGGGLELALHCDLRIAAAAARLGVPEVRLGVFPAGGGVQMLTHIVGRGRALEMILLGGQISAADARAHGLLSEVHPDDGVEDGALALARRLLACGPNAVARAKHAAYLCETLTADDANTAALAAIEAAAAEPEWWEGMAAFVERREPRFGAAQ